ncbi:MAG: glycosyltransferase [Rhodospirillales bacterium]|nr:glycosyltransferase [Rhodospirillales bacterium]
MKIAILHPYSGLAETESARRIIIACERLRHEAKECQLPGQVIRYNPDFVLSLSHQDAKLFGVPTYGVLTAPVNWYNQCPRFIRNILSYDGILTLSPFSAAKLEGLCSAFGKDIKVGFYGNTCAIEPGIANVKDPHLIYLGTNWDGHRFGDIFSKLSERSYFEVYGPEDKWPHISDQSRKGGLPFDGVSVLNAYRNAGVGLCLHLADFTSSGMPSNRIFEITAAGAVVISDENPFVREHYGDSILYVDTSQSTDSIVDQIDAHMKWVKFHPDEALVMAKQSKQVFDEKLSLDVLLPQLFDYHQSLLSQKGYDYDDEDTPDVELLLCCKEVNVSSFKKIFDSFSNQSYPAKSLVICLPISQLGIAEECFAPWQGESSVSFVTVKDEDSEELLRLGLAALRAPLFGFTDITVTWHRNHLSTLVESLKKSTAVLAASVFVEESKEILVDRLVDPYLLPRKNRQRLGPVNRFSAVEYFANGVGNGPGSWIGRREKLGEDKLPFTGNTEVDNWLLQITLLSTGSGTGCFEVTGKRQYSLTQEPDESEVKMLRQKLKHTLKRPVVTT